MPLVATTLPFRSSIVLIGLSLSTVKRVVDQPGLPSSSSSAMSRTSVHMRVLDRGTERRDSRAARCRDHPRPAPVIAPALTRNASARSCRTGSNDAAAPASRGDSRRARPASRSSRCGISPDRPAPDEHASKQHGTEHCASEQRHHRERISALTRLSLFRWRRFGAAHCRHDRRPESRRKRARYGYFAGPSRFNASPAMVRSAYFATSISVLR